MRAIPLGAVLWLACFAVCAVAEDYKPGDRVVVIADGNLTVSGNKIVDKVGPGLVLTVGDVNGEWLWLNNGKPGYLQKEKVIPLNRAAVGRLTDLLKANPNARLYAGRAIVWHSLGELDIALADFNESIRLDPKSAAYLSNRGICYAKRKEYDKAITDFDEAIRLDPKIPNAYAARGNAWHDKQEYDKAIADYDEAIRLDSKYVNAYNNRGNAWKAKQDYDKAIADFDEAIRLDPKLADAYNNRGNAWHNKREYDKAIADFDEAIRLDPKDLVALRNLGICRLARRQPTAVDDFFRVLEIDPTEAYCVLLGNLSARLMNQPERAAAFLAEPVTKLKTDWPFPCVQFPERGTERRRAAEAGHHKRPADRSPLLSGSGPSGERPPRCGPHTLRMGSGPREQELHRVRHRHRRTGPDESAAAIADPDDRLQRTERSFAEQVATRRAVTQRHHRVTGHSHPELDRIDGMDGRYPAGPVHPV